MASGIFYKDENNFYLITASHVYEDIDIPPENIGIMIQNEFYILIGELIQTVTSKSEINEKIDTAILKLNPKLIQDIQSHYNFLDNINIAFNYITTNKPRYLMGGFPVTRTKLKKHTKTIKVEPFVFLTKTLDNKIYEVINCNSETNIVVEIKQKIKGFDNTLVQTLPKLFGVSGSGLWSIEVVPPSFRLIAIMTDWDKQNSLGIGTKIDIAIQMIKNNTTVSAPN